MENKYHIYHNGENISTYYVHLEVNGLLLIKGNLYKTTSIIPIVDDYDQEEYHEFRCEVIPTTYMEESVNESY